MAEEPTPQASVAETLPRSPIDDSTMVEPAAVTNGEGTEQSSADKPAEIASEAPKEIAPSATPAIASMDCPFYFQLLASCFNHQMLIGIFCAF